MAGFENAWFLAAQNCLASVRSLVPRLSCLCVSRSSTYQTPLPRLNRRYLPFIYIVVAYLVIFNGITRKCHVPLTVLLTPTPKSQRFPEQNCGIIWNGVARMKLLKLLAWLSLAALAPGATVF